jgi:hypothetical protein
MPTMKLQIVALKEQVAEIESHEADLVAENVVLSRHIENLFVDMNPGCSDVLQEVLADDYSNSGKTAHSVLTGMIGEGISEIKKMNDEKGQTEITNLKQNEIVREELIGKLREEIKHWKGQVTHPEPLDFPLRQQLEEEIGCLQAVNDMHGAEYDQNKKRNAEWYADLEKEVEIRKNHQAGWMKLMKVIHEADPVTGMW